MGEWTKEPPTEPGWYWWRKYPESFAEPSTMNIAGHAYFRGDTEVRIRQGEGEWYSDPLPEPPIRS
jgi:hypothetical protein